MGRRFLDSGDFTIRSVVETMGYRWREQQRRSCKKAVRNDMGDILITGYTAYKDVGISCNYVNEQAALAIIDAEGISSYYAFGGMYLEDGYDMLCI